MIRTSYERLPDLIGCDLGRSSWFEVDQARVDGFAGATDDHQWIHVDVARAGEVHGGTVVHGFLTLSLLPRLAAELLEIEDMSQMINCGTNRVRFTNMLHTGRKVRLHQTVEAVEARAGGQQLVTQCTFEIEGEERPACVAESVMLILP
ncbi:acyl dehydratase [Hephaestia caeni]|uniref:Acyl dehydratase n=1 Tax=Hephaestia caeni TaxID=645617 RepID=A0A397NK90_9SPHN|nr:MaoC family dehydratase [Hephaestia caeni]RIA37972.1 acyl dehydratase [Hephaestia caeni]